MEQQAQDRIHRLGQYKPIHVTRFVIAGSIEERILKLQVTSWGVLQHHWVGCMLCAACMLTSHTALSIACHMFEPFMFEPFSFEPFTAGDALCRNC